MVDETDEDREVEVEVDDSSVGTVGCWLILKPKMSSAVWNYFGVKSDISGNPLVSKLEKPVCKLCKAVVPAKGSNTSSLFKHLKTSHPEAYLEVQKAICVKNTGMKQPTIEETIDKTKPYNPNSSQAQELNHAEASFITSEMHPYQVVENPGFKNIIAK